MQLQFQKVKVEIVRKSCNKIHHCIRTKTILNIYLDRPIINYCVINQMLDNIK